MPQGVTESPELAYDVSHEIFFSVSSPLPLLGLFLSCPLAIWGSAFLDFKTDFFPGPFRRRHELADSLKNGLNLPTMIFEL